MKNFKQIALGLIVGAMAIGFSSFTNNKSVATAKTNAAHKFSITSNYLVQPSLDSFEQATTASTDNCAGTSDRDCVYSVTTAGKSNIPNQASYTKAEIDNYVSHSWLMAAAGSSNGLYQ